MATILCVTGTQAALLYPGVELARRLLGAGHRVVYASDPGTRDLVERHGLEFVPVEPSRYAEFLARDSDAGLLPRLRAWRSRRERALESLRLDDWVEAVRRLGPDLLLIEGEMHEHIISASACGVRIALLNSFVSIWRSPGLPPPHCLARPGVGWKGTRFGSWLLWQALRLKKQHRAWTLAVRRVGCDRLSLLRRLARDSGFDLRRETDSGQWLMPFTYSRLPVLSLHSLEFEFAHRPPERVRYVGPMVLEDRKDDRTPDAVRSELEKIFERCRREGRALIYAGFGSHFSTRVDFLHRLIAAVGERGDWELVISLGGRLEPAALGALPERIHAFSWLPQPDVLRRARVALIHGGVTTADECVLAGVPMLVYCGFETDMGGTTSRIVHHGVGLAGDRRRDTPAIIRERIDRLLKDPGFGMRVDSLKHEYRAYAENQVAQAAVESLLPRTPPRS